MPYFVVPYSVFPSCPIKIYVPKGMELPDGSIEVVEQVGYEDFKRLNIGISLPLEAVELVEEHGDVAVSDCEEEDNESELMEPMAVTGIREDMRQDNLSNETNSDILSQDTSPEPSTLRIGEVKSLADVKLEMSDEHNKGVSVTIEPLKNPVANTLSIAPASFESMPNCLESTYFCPYCQKFYDRKHSFMMHLFCHVKHDIRTTLIPKGAPLPKECGLCGYQTKVLQSLLMHMALKHKLLRDYLPPDLAESLYPDCSVSDGESKRVTEGCQNEDVRLNCESLKYLPPSVNVSVVSKPETKSLNIKNEPVENLHLSTPGTFSTEMFPNDQRVDVTNKPTLKTPKRKNGIASGNNPCNAKSGLKELKKNASFNCPFCSEIIFGKHPFLAHLFCHKKHEIKQKYLPPGIDRRNCRMCNYGTDQPQSLLMHMALRHRLLKEFLPVELVDKLYSKRSSSPALDIQHDTFTFSWKNIAESSNTFYYELPPPSASSFEFVDVQGGEEHESEMN